MERARSHAVGRGDASFVLAIASFAVVFASSGTARATARSSRPTGPDLSPVELLHLDLAMTHMSVADVAFSASGTGYDGSQTHLDFHGRDIGAVHPWIYSIGLHPMALVTDHLVLGASLEMGGGMMDTMPNEAGMMARPGNGLWMFRAGVDGGGVFAFGPIELRATLGLGARLFDVPVAALRTPCRSGTCNAAAWGAQPYIQPRVAIDFVFANAFKVGAFAGVDALPSISDVTFGCFIAGTTLGWHRRARVEGWDDEPAVIDERHESRPQEPSAPPYQGSWRTLDEIERGESSGPQGVVPDVPSVRTQ